jgi:hypothetical protein
MSCWRIDVRLPKPFVHPGQASCCASIATKRGEVTASTAQLPLSRLIIGFTPPPRRCWSSTRSVYRRRGSIQGPYHANTIHSNGCPLRSSIALRHHPRRTLLHPPTLDLSDPSTNTFKRAVLRYHRRRPLKDQKHSERWQACQTLRRPVGQAKCASATLATPQCFGIAD